MDIGEGMCYDECCELCKTDDSQTYTPEANNTLYVNKILKSVKKVQWKGQLLDKYEAKQRKQEQQERDTHYKWK